MEKDIVYMQRALQLAGLGMGYVSPNPMVGCVIVHNGKIIGEGWHQAYGGPHAEVNAVNSVENSDLLAESEVYVSLEPCAHYGKTPPCADLLAGLKVKKVFICNDDPNPLVAGKGIQKLLNAGIEVDSGILKEEGLHLNRRFFGFHKNKRPYIILKWAQTADHYIARENGDSKWISCELSRTLVHKWRAEEDAVMVGKQTALHDDPALNVRMWKGKDPLRLVIDRHLSLPAHLKVFDRSQPTVLYNTVRESEEESLTYVKCRNDNFFQDIWDDLYKRKILSVMVEGGTMVLNNLIAIGMWDEARVFQSNLSFGKGIAAPRLVSARQLSREPIGDDLLMIYQNDNTWQRI
ncbi:MAG: bifunctional diaminohydroxyphosphoribosylaminopyrimidine deaminase/5-amino-6-(5-phosphoribosylamino)uracil reductase RibD [Cyclobacteriaceae bacterium]|nr:bifunctional diaminohydroxyphosphoribosylaminopyrimidine deaminase/5-amino-6-(5-phosphoribosylamino)uracil reductase RibD [Cyclobacteriaceae bacterium]